ncbi:Putative preQ0 transporter YhhQ [Olavius algarvensis spirochete endosymbiont]|uniref:queuosine precursor transporter n=1 Tax=Olavius algarvensis spirochete endosymbiont TaxID=260710 RepID=UPI000F24E857|nr:queuosine precursor transporter [Olavius algarvensis spirochete endosymbiont]VDB00360.1 Putative preQ0 transporter YhhQ [Olavius algarvensis spirochete endosymbiont]
MHSSLVGEWFSNASMGNEALWAIMLVLNFALILLIYRLFGRVGLLCWLPIAIIIANLQVMKIVVLFGLTTSLGNITYSTSFLATDILSENHGSKYAKQAVIFGFFALLSLTLFMGLALLFKPSPVDYAQNSMKTLYAIFPRIALASFVAYGVSQVNDIWIYTKFKRIQPARSWIWLRNNVSTMFSQAIDSFLFVTIAFAGRIPSREFWEIAISTYFIKWMIAAADTPLVYLSALWHKRNCLRGGT